MGYLLCSTHVFSGLVFLALQAKSLHKMAVYLREGTAMHCTMNTIGDIAAFVFMGVRV